MVHPRRGRRQCVGEFRYGFFRNNKILEDLRYATGSTQTKGLLPSLCRMQGDEIVVRVERLPASVVDVDVCLAEEVAEQIRRRQGPG